METQVLWIEVKDRLPKATDKEGLSEMVLVVLDEGMGVGPVVHVDCYDHRIGKWWSVMDSTRGGFVSHWAEAPRLPRETKR
jgi:hypothetical protein